MKNIQKCSNSWKRLVCFLILPLLLLESVRADNSINREAEIVIGYVANREAQINPFVCDEKDLVSLNQMVFESVVELNDEMKPVPLLADRWTSSGYEWTFYLRKNVIFHNGAALNAEQVYSSYKRFLEGNANNPYHKRVTMIEDMTVLDDFTIRVTSKATGMITLYAMTFPIVESSTAKDSMPRGTGPYWYTQYLPGEGVRLEMNPLWWKRDAESASIVGLRYDETGDALEALMTKEVEILCTQSNKAALSRKFNTLTSLDYSTNTYEMLVPNLSGDSVMSDLRMRKMVMYAIDTNAIVSNAYGGMGIQCEVPVNPASWLYESQSAVYYYSPERAFQLILDCGWEDMTADGIFNKIIGYQLVDLELNLITYNEAGNTIRESAANMIKSYLYNVGITVNVSVLTRNKCMSRISAGNYDIALVGVQLSDVPSLDAMFNKNGALNLNDCHSEAMISLISQTSTSVDESAMKNVYSSIQLKIVEELPVIGLLFRTGTILSTRSLSGLSGTRAGNMLNGLEYLGS